MNTIQFNEYLEKIIFFASELGIVLPNPNDNYYNDFIAFYADKQWILHIQ